MERPKFASLRVVQDAAMVVERDDHCEIAKSNLYRDHIKRVLDISFALAVLPFLLPLFAILYVLVRRDGGPFLYKHPRIGKNGSIFGCMKIRTMVVDSEAKLAELLEKSPEAREEWGASFKLQNDPRITRIGRILRKTSLDELPQVLNVLVGEMSIVGPRPITAEELEKYGEIGMKRYKLVRPGLTGPWQVTARRKNDFNSRAKLDTDYVKNVSFLNDTYYLLATVPEVLFLRGR